jgi:hypothetical protein
VGADKERVADVVEREPFFSRLAVLWCRRMFSNKWLNFLRVP